MIINNPLDQHIWSSVDKFFDSTFQLGDPFLEKVLESMQRNGLPPYQVSPSQGQFLGLLVRISQSKRVLELGTLGGYSTLWMAQNLPEDGIIVTIEAEETYARLARSHFDLHPKSSNIQLIWEKADIALNRMIQAGEQPFDFVFIDADKPSNPLYLSLIMNLVKPGSLILADNIVRSGQLVQDQSHDPRILGVRDYCVQAQNLGLSSTGIQTVGSKGYDGFTLSVVNEVR